ncbi:MAG: hypothetical protein AAF348_19630 [Bacteroidota bacterium]
MKLTIKFFVSLFLLWNFTFAQDWIKTTIADFATVEFPEQTQLTENNGSVVYTLFNDDAVYMVNVTEIPGRTSSSLTEDELLDFYEGAIMGVLESSDGELISAEEFEMDGMIGMEMHYLAPPHPELPEQRFKRIFNIDKYVIHMDFWSGSGQSEDAGEIRKRFFSSLTIVHDKRLGVETQVGEQKDSVETTGYAIGYVIGGALASLFLGVLLLGLVFLIIFLIKKQKKKKVIHPIPGTPGVKKTKVRCDQCEAENQSISKYCSQCGYELSGV